MVRPGLRLDLGSRSISELKVMLTFWQPHHGIESDELRFVNNTTHLR